MKVNEKWIKKYEEAVKKNWASAKMQKKVINLTLAILKTQTESGVVGRKEWIKTGKTGVRIPCTFFRSIFGNSSASLQKFYKFVENTSYLEKDESWCDRRLAKALGEKTWCQTWRVNYQPPKEGESVIEVELDENYTLLGALVARLKKLVGHRIDVYKRNEPIFYEVKKLADSVTSGDSTVEEGWRTLSLLEKANARGKNEKDCREFHAFALISKKHRRWFYDSKGRFATEFLDLPGAQFVTVPLGAAIANGSVKDGVLKARFQNVVDFKVNGNPNADFYKKVFDKILENDPNTNLFHGIKTWKTKRNHVKHWCAVFANCSKEDMAGFKETAQHFFIERKNGWTVDRDKIFKERTARGIMATAKAIKEVFPDFSRTVEACRGIKGALYHVQTLGEKALLNTTRAFVEKNFGGNAIRVHDAIWIFGGDEDGNAKKTLRALAKSFDGCMTWKTEVAKKFAKFGGCTEEEIENARKSFAA